MRRYRRISGGNLFSRHISSSRLKNELKSQLKTMLHGGQLALPTRRENAMEILSVSLRASTAICEAPPLNFLKPIVGIAVLVCETAKTVRSNRDAAEELAQHAINVTNCVVERASENQIFSNTNEDALNSLKGALEDVHSYLMFLNKRRHAISWLLAAQEKDRVTQLSAGLDRALSLFTTTCVLSSNELVRSNTIQLDVLASTVKQLDGEMSQNFAALHLQLKRSAGSEKATWAVKLRGHAKLGVAVHALDVRLATSAYSPASTSTLICCTRYSWSQDLSRRYLDDGSAQSTHVLKSVTKRLIAAGHAPADRTASWTARAAPHVEANTKSPPHLLPILHAAHSVRLARRHATLQKVVLTAAQAAPLPVWAYWRRPHAASVGATARAGGRGGRGGGHITAAVAQHLPGLVEAWRAERKRQLLGLLPRAGELDGADPARGGARGDADAGNDDDEVHLDLATSLFACLGSWGFWERRISCTAHVAAVLVRLVAAVLVRLAGRDPARRRWIGWTRGMCVGRGGGGRVRGAEGADGAGGRAACGGGGKGGGAGACGGCGVDGAVARQERADAAPFDEHVVREEARERHIRSKTRTSRSSSARVSVLLSEEGLVAKYRCAHCVNVLPRVVWLFSIMMRALGRHMCDKHGRDVVREEDWTRVERIAVEPTPGSSAEPTPLVALPDLSTVIKLVESDYERLISCPREQLLKRAAQAIEQGNGDGMSIMDLASTPSVRQIQHGLIPHATARLGFPPYLRPVVVLVLLPCLNAVTIHPRRSHGQRTPVVHYLSDQPSNEPLSTHCGLSAGNMRLSDLGTGYFPAAISVLTGIQGTDTKLMKFALYAVDDTANARQWCTICQTNPLMSLYQPIAVSVLEICGSVTSGTDMKLALYAVDETALIFLLFWRCTKDIVDSLRVIDDSLIFVAGFWTNIRRHIENAQISTNKRGNFTTHVVTSGTRAPHQRTHSQGTSHYWVHDMIRTDMSRSWPNVPQTW
ncbi:hypothetical protein C8J57DRAFT_1476515 [Mycena rebaudengoi]|nr:hypothetical protein C8J57DRAFT_1476515 [Mycena rebaudengoi]